jgi:hypothetical protein
VRDDPGLILILILGGLTLLVSVPWLIAFACQKIAVVATQGERAAPAGGFQVVTSATPKGDARPGDFLLRYVVLHHTEVPRPHFDLMFELAPGSPLATWRSPVWPVTVLTEVECLPPHRSDYLSYEGPVSGDRGVVRPVATGACRVERHTGHEIALRTDEGVTLLLRRVGESQQWLLEVGQTA